MSFIDLLSNPSLKRFFLAVATAATIALNKRLGLNLDPTEIVALATFVMSFVVQSAAKEVKLAGVEAAAKVKDTASAIDVINGGSK